MLSDKTKLWNGFTIVELTVALSVSAMVLATGYELFKTLRTVGGKQDEFLAESGRIINVLDQIREDLLHAVPKAYGQEAVFVGNNIIFDSNDTKLLQFYSLGVTDRFNEICGVRQIHRIVYESIKEDDSICLYRTVAPIVAKDSPSSDQKKEPILNKIDEIKISFHNGSRLETSFFSKEYLPVYVKLELTAYGQVWPLAVKLPCGTANTE
ncbi:MAG: prepilin-type N-terminal cleavage/methylation domain-containing protein [Planctomycetes bacterium]|nr:prepilin-type N-terminal cleavage/methylation domain-containing protein [Planctomycetota bacterium]